MIPRNQDGSEQAICLSLPKQSVGPDGHKVFNRHGEYISRRFELHYCGPECFRGALATDPLLQELQEPNASRFTRAEAEALCESIMLRATK